MSHITTPIPSKKHRNASGKLAIGITLGAFALIGASFSPRSSR